MDAKRIAVLGIGEVGSALASGLARHGHHIVLGSRDPSAAHVHKLLARLGSNGRAATHAEAVDGVDWVLLCVPGEDVEATVAALPHGSLDGKLVVDVTNSLSSGSAGQLVATLGLEDSVTQRMQSAYPAARFVKTFNSTNYNQMIDPRVECAPPTMPLCGNDPDAKAEIAELLRDVGWEPFDFGGVEMAGMLEELTAAWVVIGEKTGKWTHCWKIARR